MSFLFILLFLSNTLMKEVVIGLVYYNELYLIGKKRNCEHPRGLGGEWHILGGQVKDGEPHEKALKREFMEEVGLNIIVERLLDEKVDSYIWKGEQEQVKVSWYLCRAISQNVKLSNELTDHKWVPKQQVLSSIGKHSYSLVPMGVKRFLDTVAK